MGGTGINAGRVDIVKNGSGDLLLTPQGGDNSFSGTTTVNEGTLIIGRSSALGIGPVIVRSGATLVPAHGRPMAALTWDGGATVRVGYGFGTAPAVVNGALTKGTPGPYTLDLTLSLDEYHSRIEPGTYELLRFGTKVGFSASDFVVNDYYTQGGTIAMTDHAIIYTIPAPVVPPPHKVAVSVRKSRSRATFTIRNNSDIVMAFRLGQRTAPAGRGAVSAVPLPPSPVSVTYWLSGTDYTDFINRGIGVVTLGPGSAVKIVVKARPKARFSLKQIVKATLTATSVSEPGVTGAASTKFVFEP
jgi:autotransporter-associated beta strand protein